MRHCLKGGIVEPILKQPAEGGEVLGHHCDDGLGEAGEEHESYVAVAFLRTGPTLLHFLSSPQLAALCWLGVLYPHSMYPS